MMLRGFFFITPSKFFDEEGNDDPCDDYNAYTDLSLQGMDEVEKLANHRNVKTDDSDDGFFGNGAVCCIVCNAFCGDGSRLFIFFDDFVRNDVFTVFTCVKRNVITDFDAVVINWLDADNRSDRKFRFHGAAQYRKKLKVVEFQGHHADKQQNDQNHDGVFNSTDDLPQNCQS